MSSVNTSYRAVAIVLLIVWLTGCAVNRYVRPAIELPDAFRFDGGEANDLANTRWWEQFQDPILNELIESGLASNLDVRIAAARVEEFYGALGSTRAQLFPLIATDAIAGRQHLPPFATMDQYQADGFASWELDIFGRLRRLTAAARTDLLASEEGRRFAVLSLISAVASGYVTLCTLDSQLDIARRTLTSREAGLRIFEARYRRGAISELELSQSQSEYASTLASIPRLEQQQAQAENALAVLLGRNPQSLARAKTIEDLVLPAVPAGLPSEILERRPDLRQAELNLIAADARVGAAKALYFPTISLTGLWGSASRAFDSLFSGPAEIWSYATTVTTPLFTGGGIAGQVRVTEARQQQLVFAYRQAIQIAFREVDDALIAGQKSREELSAQAQRLEALRSYARLARMRHDNGYSGYLEVLDAERSLFNAELDYTRVKSDTYFALINLYKAMGGGWVIEAADRAPQPRVNLSTNPPVFP